jgi:hypothetical protein
VTVPTVHAVVDAIFDGGVLDVNYLLALGIALFSSASGALLVTILRMTRIESLRGPETPETTSNSAQESPE